ncbi:MAG: acetyl-CoA carboxylase biotin carboxylase subunit [Legionella sp.]|nr:acetyl-CoA carboxylase biotin carboxylase subunit [Legionella sp.]
MFDTILIANRGEIACRIIKTAGAMGICSVAVYSDIDKESLHVKLADKGYCIGSARAQDSYLNIDHIIAAAKASGAQAIHPGYGFLSENPKFAQACLDADLVFIGPSVQSMEAMASKQLAKQRLETTNVPLTPGYHGTDQAEARLLKEAKLMGFPILIKAANGGGGKGMRSVHQESDFMPALAAAKRESLASFADDTVILEKLILNPRHIEVQVMADSKGQVVHLFERDCSIQRRHQKIIEEAPALGLPDTLRKDLAKAACEVAQSIQYTGAGTVEFLVENNERFYFMEMNTRLQVEHPVTELITGLDLVAWQLKIAAGESLPLTQNEIHAKGHAIECRIYAEDPFNEFVPSIGQIHMLHEPSGEGIRIDSGITLGSHISKYYDPMIAKLIAFGETRTESLQRMEQALNHFYIGGVKTNLPFLQAICQNPQFKAATISTDFLEKTSLSLKIPDKTQAILMTIGFDYLKTIQAISDPLFQDSFAWQSHTERTWVWSYLDGDERLDAYIYPINHTQCTVTMRGEKHALHSELVEDTLYVEIDNHYHKAQVYDLNKQVRLFTEQGQIEVDRFSWSQDNKSVQKGQLTAPMSATVVAILKNVGDTVKKGDSLIVLEAMKMEHTIHAPADGILSEVYYKVGSQVDEGAQLLALSAADQ